MHVEGPNPAGFPKPVEGVSRKSLIPTKDPQTQAGQVVAHGLQPADLTAKTAMLSFLLGTADMKTIDVNGVIDQLMHANAVEKKGEMAWDLQELIADLWTVFLSPPKLILEATSAPATTLLSAGELGEIAEKVWSNSELISATIKSSQIVTQGTKLLLTRKILRATKKRIKALKNDPAKNKEFLELKKLYVRLKKNANAEKNGYLLDSSYSSAFLVKISASSAVETLSLGKSALHAVSTVGLSATGAAFLFGTASSGYKSYRLRRGERHYKKAHEASRKKIADYQKNLEAGRKPDFERLKNVIEKKREMEQEFISFKKKKSYVSFIVTTLALTAAVTLKALLFAGVITLSLTFMMTPLAAVSLVGALAALYGLYYLRKHKKSLFKETVKLLHVRLAFNSIPYLYNQTRLSSKSVETLENLEKLFKLNVAKELLSEESDQAKREKLQQKMNRLEKKMKEQIEKLAELREKVERKKARIEHLHKRIEEAEFSDFISRFDPNFDHDMAHLQEEDFIDSIVDPLFEGKEVLTKDEQNYLKALFQKDVAGTKEELKKELKRYLTSDAEELLKIAKKSLSDKLVTKKVRRETAGRNRGLSQGGGVRH